MNEYNQVNVKLSPHNWISWNQTGVTLRINIKMCSGNNFPHELLLTTRQKTKLINAFENNMSTNIMLSKAQISNSNL